MKNKIKQFAKGDFKLQRPDIVFPETHLFISVGEGEVYQGSFYIENQKDGEIRGLVYPSSYRVHCLEQGFEGNPVKVNFTYDSAGMLPGEIEEGKFTVVCNGGEYELTFSAMVEKPFVMTAYGKVQSVSDFKRVAMQDFAEARRLFRSRQFSDILKYEDCRVRNLYDNFRTWALDEQALEEFLVGIKQKEKLFLTLSSENFEYCDVQEEKKDIITITKNTWGYVSIKIKVSGEFLQVNKKRFTTDDFVGNSFQLEYVIQKNKLHAGINYGKISVETPYETLEVVINVKQRVKKDPNFGEKGMIAGKALKDYLYCLAGKTDLHAWMDKALASVKQLRQLEPENEYYMLLQAHVYLRGRREEEAAWILENGKFNKFVIGRKAEISAYYLYLQAVLKKDSVSQMKALDEVNRLYVKYPYSWPLLCMLINLDPKYKNYQDRIRVLERQFYNGSNQMLLYAEAYLCFQEKAVLLRKVESFEIQILNFASKYNVLIEELALRAAELVIQQKKYNAKLVRILERAYAVHEDETILYALCSQFIKGNKTGPEYFKWYDLAVRQGLKVAQLYEYYMMSMDLRRTRTAFPKIVYLYFAHGINLDYRRVSFLYENILTYEGENSDIYQTYREQMIEFARQQLLKRHVNDSLRVLYNRFFNENNLGVEELEALYDICHKYHVTTTREDMKYVLVIEKDGSIRQRAAYTEYGANVYLYDKEARIVWEAKDGCHYTDSILYDTVRLFYEMRFMELCKKRISGDMATEKNEESKPLSFENLKLYGMQSYDEEEVFLLCTKRIREQEDMEDDFLLYLCFALFQKGIYDKVLLRYLAHYFCGATADMKQLWRVAKEYGVQTSSLAERIITQMLYSEVMSQEAEIFEDYYLGKPYFRLKQAYLAYVSNQYVIKNRVIPKNIFTIMIKEFRDEEYLADICKVAILKYFSDKEMDVISTQILQGYLQEMCGKHLIFAFYQNYPKSWLREVQLYDKYLVEYHAVTGGRVKIFYRINGGQVCTEPLMPTYEDTYIKEFVLYNGETFDYYFTEEEDGKTLTGQHYRYVHTSQDETTGKYGRLNQISELSEEAQEEAMLQYKREELLAEELFQTY